MGNDIVTNSPEEKKILAELERRKDADSKRMKRFLDMPDLSRTAGSPIHAIVKRILALPDFKDFSIITSPEIIPADISFDLFNFPKDHPARKKSDTYFPDDNHVLRTHTTVMWYYHLNNPTVKEKIKKGLPVGALSYGKVYRRDEIDRHHMNIFHQMDGWYLCQKKEKIIGLEDLKDVLVKIANAVYGKDMEDYRFNKDEFPYTDPSLEMEIKLGGKWIEVLGSGVVRAVVLDNLGVDSKIYNGWAFGFGLERLAILSMNLPDIRLLWSNDERVKKQLHLGQNFKEVSKYPPITRDISFIVDSNFVPNDYYDLIRDLGGDLVEEVKLLDTYKDPKKFGAGKISYTYRIIYRSNERTLKASEVDAIQDKIYSQTVKKFKAQLR
jgi:phenylalanyl-tRNA synthetase alpha chain